MSQKNKERIETLLDQLENPNLTAGDIERIEQKIELLRKLEG